MLAWCTKITYILVIVEILCLAHAGRLPLRDELDDVHGAVVVVVELGDDPSDLIIGLGAIQYENIRLVELKLEMVSDFILILQEKC